jgi:hypothetical protein
MGTWDAAPWDNDAAADWFGDLFDQTGVAMRVEETLLLDPQEAHEEIRAAAAMLLFLGRTYVWPIDDLDRHLKLAIKRLEEIEKLGVYEEAPEIVERVRREAELLRSRLRDGKLVDDEAARQWWLRMR